MSTSVRSLATRAVYRDVRFKPTLYVNMLNLDHLGSTQFEELTVDLLRYLKYTDISWRKGTGMTGASPSDSGRDIECSYHLMEPDGSTRIERWFVECKHYKRGVPPAAIQGALAWAEAESPSCLLFVCSNYLSNGAKDHLQLYRSTRAPKFQIKIWENIDIERLVAGSGQIQQKYKLPGIIRSLEIAHPLHLSYVLAPKLNTKEYFIECLEQIDPLVRDRLFGNSYYEYVSPRFRNSTDRHETMRDLQIEQVNYDIFKSKLLSRSDPPSVSLVHGIVSWTLAWFLKCGDPRGIDETKETYSGFIDYCLDKMKTASVEEKSDLEKIVERNKKEMAGISDRCKRNLDDYVLLNEEVVSRLLIEVPEFPPVEI